MSNSSNKKASSHRIDLRLAKLMDKVRTGEHVPKAKVFALLNKTNKAQPK
jgi:hypothetical protein